MATDCILIFDVGKTNKKILVFDQQYTLLHEESVQLEEIKDEDGFECEDVSTLTEWVEVSLKKFISHKNFNIKAINFSGYGASFVCVDSNLKPVLALSNYLKPYPIKLQVDFYEKYGRPDTFTKVCASPALGSLNSGLQLYRTKKEKPNDFNKIKWALHLPQYLSSIVTRTACSDMTSIGCHTGLWDFAKNSYHEWVSREGIDSILANIRPSDETIFTNVEGLSIPVGIGLHDSSAALVPYLVNFKEPFVLLSTGTWNISLNPFNHSPLTTKELKEDCLCYLSFTGKRVKASRLFAGHDHDMKVKLLAEKFNVHPDYFQNLKAGQNQNFNFEELPAIAYLDFMKELVNDQERSLRLLLGNENVSRIFVDGGFGKNSIFMQLLSQRFSTLEVFAATVPQASSLGAAIAIHSSWNSNPIPEHLIDLKKVHH
jgi:sugar (pentulose or hexulose) kinase